MSDLAKVTAEKAKLSGKVNRWSRPNGENMPVALEEQHENQYICPFEIHIISGCHSTKVCVFVEKVTKVFL